MYRGVMSGSTKSACVGGESEEMLCFGGLAIRCDRQRRLRFVFDHDRKSVSLK